MNLLAIDVGSSSVKAGILRSGRVVGRVVRVAYDTDFDGPAVEVPAARISAALSQAIGNVGAPARRAEAIALSVMSPAWVAMDARGRALTPIVTHQDRRSVEEAAAIERRVGRDRHLRLAGNRPFPGGISSTTWAWFRAHSPGLLRKTDLVGHLNTLLHRQITGARVIDPSNASFTGLYETIEQGGWNAELCDAAVVPSRVLPQILPAGQVGGKVLRAAATRYGLTQGTPMLVGIVDTSSAMLLAGARRGQLINTMGSTDVLGLCTDRPVPHEKLLTRALGVGPQWMSVSTLAAAGSAVAWAKDQFFADYAWPRFQKLIRSLAAQRRATRGEAMTRLTDAVEFEPYLAGDRTSIEQRRAAFRGLTLSTTREQMLAALLRSLAETGAARLTLLGTNGTRFLRRVVVSGGAKDWLQAILHREWGKGWTFDVEPEATLRGLSRLVE